EAKAINWVFGLAHRRRRALGRARLRARPNLAGCGEVTSPLFSINSILNANRHNIRSRRAVGTHAHARDSEILRGCGASLK
ncbi:MAG: hypothetical protein ACLPQX_15230, partial [Syntrophobacteraceae bacterium]